MWSYVIIKLLLPSSVLHSVLAMLVLHSLLAVLLPVVLPSKLPKNNIHFFTSQLRLDDIEEDTSQDLIEDGSLNTMLGETENVRGSLKYYQNIPEITANEYHNDYYDAWLPCDDGILKNISDEGQVRLSDWYNYMNGYPKRNGSENRNHTTTDIGVFSNISRVVTLNCTTQINNPLFSVDGHLIEHPNLSTPYINYPLNIMNHPNYPFPPWENLTLEQQTQFVMTQLGNPQRYTPSVTTTLGVYYGGLLVIGLLGNLLTSLIILTNSYMRTAPNMYLLNLAVVDIITLIISKLTFCLMFAIFNFR